MPIPIFINSLDYIIIDHGPYLNNSNLAWKIDTESTFFLSLGSIFPLKKATILFR